MAEEIPFLDRLIEIVQRDEEEDYETVYSADEEHQRHLTRYVDVVLAALQQRASATRKPRDIWEYYNGYKVFLQLASTYLPARLAIELYRAAKYVGNLAYDHSKGWSRWAHVLRYTEDLQFITIQLLKRYGVFGRRRIKEPEMKDVALQMLREIVNEAKYSNEDLQKAEEILKQKKEDESIPEW